MAIQTNGTEIVLSGVVGGSSSGSDWFDPDGFASSDVIQALAAMGDQPVTVRLNSYGGVAVEGEAIRASLASYKGAVTMVIEGVAASAASLVAMGGDTVMMTPGSVLMIHDPANITIGDAAEHERTIRQLNALGSAYARVYADKTGATPDEMRALMKETTWFTADEAVAAGFADGVVADAEPVEPVPFAYGLFHNAPPALAALAQAKGWRSPMLAAARAAAPQMKDAAMTEETTVEPTVIDEPEATQTDPGVATAAATDVVAIAAECAAFGMPAERINAFIAGGGSLEKAKARAEEVRAIEKDIALAKKANRAITLTTAEAVARDLTHSQVLALLWPQVTAQVSIDPGHTPAKAPQDPLMKAVARANERNAKVQGR